jgi:hypothetical protein
MRRAHGVALSSFAIGVLAACGGSTTGGGSGAGQSGSVVGTVAATTFTVASEVAALSGSSETSCVGPPFGADAASGCTTVTSRGVTVLLTNRSDLTCPALQSDVAGQMTLADYANLDLLLVGVNVASGDIVAGSYPVVSDGLDTGAQATLVTTSSTCGEGLDLSATSGTVTLTQVSLTDVAGTYSVTFGTQGTFTGSFAVAMCALPDAGEPPPGKSTCVQ